MSGVLDKVNETQVDPELLREVLEMHAEMSPEDRKSFEVRTIRTIVLLSELGFEKDGASLLTAIDFRLTALAQLLEEEGGRGFRAKGSEPGQERVHADLIRCTAEEPLIEDGDERPRFDAKGFHDRLLLITEMRGNA